MQQSMRLSILLFFICSVTLLQAIPAPSEKTSFRITILKSSGEPQPGIVLKIKTRLWNTEEMQKELSLSNMM